MLLFLPTKLFAVLNIAVPFILSLLLIFVFRRFLPKDQGREFAFNGALSAGKIRGAGLLFIIALVLSSPLFVTPNAENLLYLACVFISMLSGYFDDRSKTP